MNIVGYLHGRDPSACLLRDGKIVAYVEEERLIRQKHATGIFPIRSIELCLKQGGVSPRDVDCFAFGYDAPRFSNGEIANFYESINRTYPPDPATRSWQLTNLRKHSIAALQSRLDFELLRHFGTKERNLLRFYPHHRAHAAAAFHLAPFDEGLVLILDGSGDHQCTTIWHGCGNVLNLLYEINIPHSLGWFYSAATEYLGFEAYDGEYKVMGLAAYGRPNAVLRKAISCMLASGPAAFDYTLECKYIHCGPHSYSGRFTDHLIDLLGFPPRSQYEPLTAVHEDFAYETQLSLEETVLRLLRHFRRITGLKNLCVGGGVAQNVKMNGRIHDEQLFDQIFIFPIPSDSGTSVGAALGVFQDETGRLPSERFSHVYWGPSYSDAEIETELLSCGVPYQRVENIIEITAVLLCSGHIVGWFQGGMEGGPRALGARSILADPRSAKSRDLVNQAIKYREYWRPFCPSLTEESAFRFVKSPCSAPFMIMAFAATDEASDAIPAVVHVDGTMRVQTVDPTSNPQFYQLLKAFEAKAGVGVLLNTSFNIKGEPMVCSPKDALRTFWSTGLDALAIGNFLLTKPITPYR